MPRDQEIPSRRSVLRGAAGAGAAGIAATALGGLGGQALAAPAPSRTARPADQHETEHAAGDEPIVAHVRDVRAGHIDLYRGTGSAQVRDPELAARLARAARQVR
jgi:hypothetical protein